MMIKIIHYKNHETIMLVTINIIFLNKYPAKNCGAVHCTRINQTVTYEILEI